MYTVKDFKTKKALKDAVSAGEEVSVYQPEPYGANSADINGDVALEGPHYPLAHTWYAQATVKNGVIVGKVK